MRHLNLGERAERKGVSFTGWLYFKSLQAGEDEEVTVAEVVDQEGQALFSLKAYQGIDSEIVLALEYSTATASGEDGGTFIVYPEGWMEVRVDYRMDEADGFVAWYGGRHFAEKSRLFRGFLEYGVVRLTWEKDE